MNSRLDPFEAQTLAPSRRALQGEDADRVDVRAMLRAILRRHWIVSACGFGLGLLFLAVASLLPPTYSASAKVMLDPRKIQILPAQEVVSNLDLSEPVILGEISVLRSNVLISELIRAIGLERLEAHYHGAPRDGPDTDSRTNDLVWKIRKDLNVYREGESYVIVIVFEGSAPALVKDVADGLADTYIAMQLSGRRESARQASVWIRQQVDDLRHEVERAENAVARYRAERLERDGGSFETASQQLGNLSSQLIVARSERVASEARHDQLRMVLERQGAGALAQVVTSPTVERLNDERLGLLREDAEWAASFDADHPRRERIRREIARLDQTLGDEAEKIIDLRRSEVEVARLREASLAESIQDLEGRISGISATTLGLRQLEREAEAARLNYEALLSRLSEMRSQEQLQQPDARLIERATYPEVPSAPRPKLMGAFGGMLGGVIGLTLVLFLEMTRPTFRNRQELEAETGLPVLASLPLVARTGMADLMRQLRANSHSIFGERVRHLRTFLLMRNGRGERRAILVVSSNPGEGKSTTAVALAQMAALAGKSVILVDADLRRSTLAAQFGWRMGADLPDFIQYRADLAAAIHSDADMGIDVLSPALPCPEAADRLSANWLNPVMQELKRVYDVVIIDSPPLLKVSDALVLARVADSIVYVVRWDSTTRAAVRDGLDALAEMRLGVTGIVLSMVDPKLVEEAYGPGYASYA